MSSDPFDDAMPGMELSGDDGWAYPMEGRRPAAEPEPGYDAAEAEDIAQCPVCRSPLVVGGEGRGDGATCFYWCRACDEPR